MNYANFNKVLTHIERHPGEWRQASCKHCFLAIAAGMADDNYVLQFASTKLSRWLGLSFKQMTFIYGCDTTLGQLRAMRLVAARVRLAKAAG